MDREQLVKVWGVVALILLFYVLNTWLSSQGASPILDVELLDKRRVPGALIALVICPPLLALAATIGEIYRTRHGGQLLWLSIPTPGIGTLDAGRTEARVYIVIQLCLIYVLPALSFIHFGWIVFEAEVCVRHPDVAGLSVWSVPEMSRLNSHYRLDGWNLEARLCDTGVTFWPILMPVLLVVWVSVSVAIVARHLWRLFRLPLQALPLDPR